MYRAVEDQLAVPQRRDASSAADESDQQGEASRSGDTPEVDTSSYTELRQAAADWMRGHPQDFMPFITRVGTRSQHESCIGMSCVWCVGFADAWTASLNGCVSYWDQMLSKSTLNFIRGCDLHQQAG